MKEQNFYNATLYYRLVALWVVCEAFAGGLMHAAKIPFTGMIVSSLAVCCIMLIAYHIPSRNAILKATMTVAFFKLLLSPHSPPTAYIAVFFQGYLGYLFFNHRKHFVFSAVSLAVLALVESALQRLLVLVLLYGNSFWGAFDIYIQRIVGGSFDDYSVTVAGIYVSIHAITGLIVGITAAKFIKRSRDEKSIRPYLLASETVHPSTAVSKGKKKPVAKHWIIMLWIIVFGFYLQAIFDPANAVLPVNKILLILVRSILIILTWYLVLAPLALKLITHFIKKQQKRHYLPIAEIQQIIPDIQQVFFRSWQLSAANTGLARIKFFIRILFINIIHGKSNVEFLR